jgi:hypothetical protein
MSKNPNKEKLRSHWTYLKVGRRTRKRLNIHSPFLRVKIESFQSSLLAQQFNLIDVFVSSIVASSRVTFTIFIRKDGTESLRLFLCLAFSCSIKVVISGSTSFKLLLRSEPAANDRRPTRRVNGAMADLKLSIVDHR